MKTNPVGSINASQKGTAIGTAAGLGAGSAYLIKNRKDIFEKGIQSGINAAKEAGKTISKNKSIAIAGGVAAAIVGATTAAGALIGKGIGKLVDKHNQKKQDLELQKFIDLYENQLESGSPEKQIPQEQTKPSKI
ncbi:MAG: hypothetical protein LUH05_01945 [Candidatus Gastranaerophilales bacterium]|nr:hypothetical protein [Candidatus Gastranaerophilales bacterium]